MALPPVLSRLHGRRVVLASASPRRRDILGYTGLRFEVVPPEFPETLDKAAFRVPQDYAVETARRKALSVGRALRGDPRAPDVVIGADTIVVVDGLILEKPRDAEDAFRMLRRLSGRQHSVFTGVAVLLFSESRGHPAGSAPSCASEPEVRTFWEETRVTFSEVTDELLWDYVDSGEPMDKAGGYGIQARGGMLVERLEGDFLNVVGFPLNRLCRELAALLSDRTPTVTTHPGAMKAPTS
ncbi:hypothetical protein STEG23_008248 [Scotinomys teguina]